MMLVEKEDYSRFFDELDGVVDWDLDLGLIGNVISDSSDNFGSQSCGDSIATRDTPIKPRSKKRGYSRTEVKKQVHEVSCEEASYFVNTIVNALNAYDPVALEALLSKVCVPDLLVMTQCYDGAAKLDDHDLASPMTAYPIVGVEQFALYWSMVTQHIPDGVFMNKIEARPCSTEGDASVYVGGVAFQGTSLVKEGGDLFISFMMLMAMQPPNWNRGGFAMAVTKVSLSGSILVYVNTQGFIYRIDLFLEY